MPPTGTKRPYSGSGSGHRSGPKPPPQGSQSQSQQPAPTGPFIPMFTEFRNELDEHHDRRERIIKASRDVTAASKKIIFTLQRLRPTTLPLTEPLPYHITNEISQYESKIQTLLASILPDLQDLNGSRYQRQISPGLQEYIEAVGFRHYLLKGTAIKWEEAAWYASGLNADEILGKKSGEEEKTEGGTEVDVEMVDAQRALSSEVAAAQEGGDGNEMKEERTSLQGIKLSREDYVLALFDMTGEMMRFAITSIATTSLSELIPTPISQVASEGAKNSGRSTPRALLQDLRELQLAFEGLGLGRSPFGKDAEKKLEVMQQSVQKVEYAFYGIAVRGSERPDGWVAEVDVGGGTAE